MSQFAPKPFQLLTINQVTKSLEQDGSRYLVADEVGLGKTIVAKGVIEKLYKTQTVRKPFRVIYLCSSMDIGKQNVEKLKSGFIQNVQGEEDKKSVNSRLTLIALEAPTRKDENRKRLDLICLTPRTSLQLGNNVGQKKERKLLHALLLSEVKGSKQKSWANFFIRPATDGTAEWLESVKAFARSELPKLEKMNGLRAKVLEAWRKKHEFLGVSEELRKRMGPGKSLIECVQFIASKYPEKLTDSEDHRLLRRCRSYLIGQLRSELALCTLMVFQADLIVLDEFQNFSDVLMSSASDSDENASETVAKVFEHKIAHALWDTKARLLLLSATPYKAASSDFGSFQDSHYAHFWSILNFLFKGDTQKLNELRESFKQHRLALENPTIVERKDAYQTAIEAKKRIRKVLSKVMARTERYRSGYDVNAGVNELFRHPWVDTLNAETEHEIAREGLQPNAADARYLEWLYKTVPEESSQLVKEFWNSLPFALNLMESHYKIIEKSFGKADRAPENILEAIKWSTQRSGSDPNRERFWLERNDLLNLDLIKISPNPKIRALLHDLRNEDFGRHLWTTPTSQYYSSESTPIPVRKRLIFSSWQAVPQAVSILASMDAEARMIRKLREAKKDVSKYTLNIDLPKKNSDKSLRSSVVLYHPCQWLSTLVDPAYDSLKYPSLVKLRSYVGSKLKKLFDGPGAKVFERKRRSPNEQSNLADIIWRFESSEFKRCYSEAIELSRSGRHKKLNLGLDQNYLDQSIRSNSALYYSPDEFEALIDLAIGGPGVCLLRVLKRHNRLTTPLSSEELLHVLQMTYVNIRNYFNTSQAGLALRVTYLKEHISAWRMVAKYCSEHHYQAMLDEFAFLAEQDALTSNKPIESLRSFLEILKIGFYIPIGNPSIRAVRKGKIDRDPIHRHVAQAFTDEKSISTEDGQEKEVLRDQIRKSFNSPFWPFVLATTSIGQEGLDFHRYCKDVIHWNLPHSPVAFEQREGRVQRYLGLSIRSALVQDFPWAKLLYGKKLETENPWKYVLKKAEELDQLKGLSPFWIYKGKTTAQINRHIFCHPFSKEAVQYRRMRESVLLYRLTLGQARQDDLIEAVQRALKNSNKSDLEQENIIRNLWIDLAPK